MKNQKKSKFNKRLIFIISIIILAILLIPIPFRYDGGPSEYRAVIYTVYRYGHFDGDRVWSGIRINVFNMIVFDNVRAVWNEELSPENRYEVNLRDDNTTTETSIDFNLETTIRVLSDALVDADITAESIIVVILQEVGIQGAVQATLIDEPGRVLTLEIVSEDEKTYQLIVARRVFSDITYYIVHAIQDMQTGEYIFAEVCGLGDVDP